MSNCSKVANVYTSCGGGYTNSLTKKEYIYTNTIDSFESCYDKGFRYFEYDLVVTSDKKLVGSHKYEYHKGYSEDNPISYDTYVNTKILGSLTGVTIANLVPHLLKHEDAFAVIDGKVSDYVEYYTILANEIRENVEEKDFDRVIGQFIPQIYNKNMWEEIKEIMPFTKYMFTNYRAHYTSSQILKYFDDERIIFITLPAFNFVNCSKLKRHGKKILFHTVNDKFSAGFLTRFKSGYGFYTNNTDFSKF